MKNKKIFFAVAIVGLVILFSRDSNYNRPTPVILGAEGLLPAMNIDYKIREAEIILIGEVTTNLPSRWNAPDGNDSKSASPEEVSRAHGLFTDSIISIQQILKGKIATPVVRVRSFSGEIETVIWVSDSEPSFIKKRTYLLFLVRDTGATAGVDPGDYVSVTAKYAIYEIIDGKAISADDEWVLEELIAYIQKTLSSESPLPTFSPVPTELLIETLTPLPTANPTELLTETPTELPTQTLTPTETAGPTP